MANQFTGFTDFDNTKTPRDLTQFNLMYGVTDFGDLYQFNRYESGYSFLRVVEIPKYLSTLAAKDAKVSMLLKNYVHAIQYEFRGLDSIDALGSETGEISDGITTVNFINKVTMQTSTYTMRFFEKSGSLFTKVHAMFLKGVKDPRTQIKNYHGLIDSGDILNPGIDQEMFTFLYFTTDNTVSKIEKAFLFACAQPTSADYTIYNSEKGNPESKEISIEFNAFMIEGKDVDGDAANILADMNVVDSKNRIIKSSTGFDYTGVGKATQQLHDGTSAI